MKKKFDQLAVEVTRKCNMNCEHCLRGCAQNVNIQKKTIDLLLDSAHSINCLTITGGEPLLNMEGIHYLIDEIMRREIYINSFYMVTNGTIFDKDLFFKLIEFYWYCDDPENYSGVAVSIDEFHDNEEYQSNIDKWKSLKFYKEDKEVDNWEPRMLIQEGNAIENDLGMRTLYIREDKVTAYDEGEHIYLEDMTYVNVYGQVCNDCDMSYDTQNENHVGTLEADDYYEID